MTTCDHCGYQWQYSGDRSTATCPDCRNTTETEHAETTDENPSTTDYDPLHDYSRAPPADGDGDDIISWLGRLLFGPSDDSENDDETPSTTEEQAEQGEGPQIQIAQLDDLDDR